MLKNKFEFVQKFEIVEKFVQIQVGYCMLVRL